MTFHWDIVGSYEEHFLIIKIDKFWVSMLIYCESNLFPQAESFHILTYVYYLWS